MPRTKKLQKLSEEVLKANLEWYIQYPGKAGSARSKKLDAVVAPFYQELKGKNLLPSRKVED